MKRPRAEPIGTERLILEPPEVGHAMEMAVVLARPTLHRFTGGRPPASSAELRAVIGLRSWSKLGSPLPAADDVLEEVRDCRGRVRAASPICCPNVAGSAQIATNRHDVALGYRARKH